ncbi:hypothetical protein AB0B89_25805, partial [Sphaerisporangium sp. NPDC049002]
GASLAQRLARLGVDATSAAEAPAGALVVAPEGAAPPQGAHLLVRAEQDADPVEWEAVTPVRAGI